ncbi:methyltransferase domain-containing protein [Streptomyces sp. UNOC14_S4]|nr:methyltransferase domain-containing protein [Streptomyces sp. UNOC14_S4]
MRTAFLEVPRHAFVRDTVWVLDGSQYRPVSRADDPERWARAVYAPTAPAVTQVDDGAPGDTGTGREPTSSISAPDAVFTMLDVADPRPGSRVLEIGTGTGWNAALLAGRCGQSRVTTIEIDPRVADEARTALAAAGCPDVTVIRGDGALGHASGAPYTHVISTAAVFTVPYAWVGQAAPGGSIVTPFTTAFCPHGLARLTVGAEGAVGAEDGTAHGFFAGAMTFMPLRAQRTENRIRELFTDQAWQESRDSKVGDSLAALGSPHAEFAAGLLLPGIAHWRGDDGEWLCGDGSWALVCDEGCAHQWGPRSLADEAARAAAWWQRQGEPELYEFGLTVTRDGQRYWLREPDATLMG